MSNYTGKSHSDLTAMCMVLERELSAMKQRAEAAEARITASQEQEPSGWAYGVSSGDMYGITLYKDNSELEPLYASPIISPDVAELQRDNAELRAGRNSLIGQAALDEVNNQIIELTRKLAEQQAALYTVRAILAGCNAADAIKAVTHIQKHFADNSAELIKLLSEANGTAVPEGWRLVPIKATGEMLGYGTAIMHNEKGRNPYFIVQRIYEGMLSAAPQPETDRGSNE